jgi:hypothetical protein
MGFFQSVYRLGKKVAGNVARLGAKADKAVRRHFAGSKHVASMGHEDKMMAHMASDAYETGRKDINGYRYNAGLSSDQHAVYHNPKTKRTVLAMRGTVPTDLRDLRSDKALLLGRTASDPRYKQSLQTYDKVKAHYGGGDVHVTGHSLGGHLSNMVARKRGARATTFNAGQSATKQHAKDVASCHGLNPPAWCSRIRTHKIGGDAISALAGGYGDTHTYQSKGLVGSHSMDNFMG